MSGILVGVDGSGHSTRALEWAAREAAVRHTPLTVVTVYQLMAGYGGGAVGYVGDEELATEAEAEAKKLTDKVLAGLDRAPASVTVRGVAGLPADVLLSASAEADMIVLGSRGAGGFKRLLLGSVASQVTHHAHVPVVIIPAENF